jgi:hypothetical protein
MILYGHNGLAEQGAQPANLKNKSAIFEIAPFLLKNFAFFTKSY